MASAGGRPEDATQHLPFMRLSPALAMLRVRFAFVRQQNAIEVFENRTPPLPSVLLVSNYLVVPTRDALLAEVLREDFDPRRLVLLEQHPHPQPAASGAPGSEHVISWTSDTVELVVDTPSAALLLMTDQYSRDWRVRPLMPSVQPAYDVLPANYVLRAIPLAAGRHHLLLEYVPAGLVPGAVVTCLALLAWIRGWMRNRPPRMAAAPRE
jgi:hypothetical protein